MQLPPYAHKLVGHDFIIGDNPRVNAQFSAQYCVANAIVRRESTLANFVPINVRDPALTDLIPRIAVEPVSAMEARHHTAVDLEVMNDDGQLHRASLDIAPGFPDNELSGQEHRERFESCLDYANTGWDSTHRVQLLDTILSVQDMDDVRGLIRLCTRAAQSPMKPLP